MKKNAFDFNAFLSENLQRLAPLIIAFTMEQNAFDFNAFLFANLQRVAPILLSLRHG